MNHHIFIIFLVTYTMSLHTKYCHTIPELNSSHDSSDKSFCHFCNGNGQLQDDVLAYRCAQIQNDNPRVNEGILVKELDTLSPADIVREQYAVLPYPAVTREEIDELRRHYQGINRHLPYMIVPHNELDVVNHFLYKGRNDFMYERF